MVICQHLSRRLLRSPLPTATQTKRLVEETEKEIAGKAPVTQKGTTMVDMRGFSPMHLRARIVYAHIKTYQGLSLGASHWFGKLKTDGCETIELTRVITAQEAETLNKKSKGETYDAGEMTNKWSSRVSVRVEAIRVYGQSFPLAVLLIEGRIACRDPQHVLIGPPGVQEKLNALVEQAQMIGFWDYTRHENTMQRIADEWDAIIDAIKNGLPIPL